METPEIGNEASIKQGCMMEIFLGLLLITFAGGFATQFYKVVRGGGFLGIPDEFTLLSLFCTIGIIALILPPTKRYYGIHDLNTKRSNIFAVVGGTSIIFFSNLLSGLVIANAFFDRSEPSIQKTLLIFKRAATAKNSTSYLFTFADWKNPNQKLEVKVSRDFYESKEIGAPLIFITKPGAFRHEWIVRIE